ncbi:MAG: hypothetical protein ACREXR_05745 [Gammaproteobacteria bacterium]
MAAESDVAALGQTASGKSVVCQEVRSEGMGVDDFGSAVARFGVLN